MPETHLALLDGTNTLHRAFYTPAPSAIKVIDSIVHSLAYHHMFTHLLVVFDSKYGDLYRESLYPQYKANRNERPDGMNELEEQFKQKFPQHVSYPGVDGDDVLYSLALRAIGIYDRISIVTADKDLLQAVNPAFNITVIDPSTKKVYRQDSDVMERLDVPINRVAHFLALAGDKTDHIPGVPRIGDVKAKQIIAEVPDPATHKWIVPKLDVYKTMLQLTLLRDIGIQLPELKPLGVK